MKKLCDSVFNIIEESEYPKLNLCILNTQELQKSGDIYHEREKAPSTFYNSTDIRVSKLYKLTSLIIPLETYEELKGK